MSPVAQAGEGFSGQDHEWMARALRLAARGMWTTRPNPMVGCVIADGDTLLGEGWHQRAGGDHAEVVALQAAGSRARGATAYVTLEPCAHHGRTPPCTDALKQAGVGRVVAALGDPFDEVAGQGFAMLAAAGIRVDTGLMEGEARALNRAYFSRIERGRPWLRIKLAMSLDGRTALSGGESRWISSEASRADVQCWRARAGALMTGIGTVVADDPRLTARPAATEGVAAEVVAPLRVVLDSGGRLPVHARLNVDGAAPTLLVHAEDTRPVYGDRVEALAVRRSGSGLDLGAVLGQLARRGVNEVQTEAGPTLSGALLAAGLVDEVLLYVAPVLLGEHGLPLLAGVTPASMADRLQFEPVDSRRIGPDFRLLLQPARAGSGH